MRVPALDRALTPLADARWPVLQSSANPSGGAGRAARSRTWTRASARSVDLELDGGELPGTPSTVVDLTGYARGDWDVLREGAVPRSELEAAL